MRLCVFIKKFIFSQNVRLKNRNKVFDNSVIVLEEHTVEKIELVEVFLHAFLSKQK